MPRPEVVITGCGAITPAGVDTDALWAACLAGRSAVSAVPWAAYYGLRAQVAAQIDRTTLETARDTADRELTETNRHRLLGRLAARAAIRQAGFTPHAIVAATAIGGFTTTEAHYMDNTTTIGLDDFNFDGLARAIAADAGIDGPRVTISTGCTSGLDALGHALWMLRSGVWQSALVVAADAPLSPTTLAAFDVLGAVTSAWNDEPSRASRPFDAARSGFVLGEAGAAIVLETATHAQARGATPLARLRGFGSVNSGFHMTDIAEDGAAIAASIRAAMQDTDDPALATHIDYINAHGSGTRQNDAAEAAAYHSCLGPRAGAIPVNSTKSIVGHSLGAANLVEVIHIVLQMQHTTITPNANLEVCDPAIRLHLPTSPLHDYRIEVALKTSSGFSGIHSALLLDRSDGEEVV